jgi:hypothetical protein
MILERGNDDKVSQFAANNPNCPIPARLNWLIMIGEIEQAHQEFQDAYLDDFKKQQEH